MPGLGLRPFLRLYLRWLQAWDRRRLRRLAQRHPGVEIHPTASSNLAAARFELAPASRLVIGPGVSTERLPGRLLFHVEEGASLEIGGETWLRCEVEKIRLVAYAGASLVVADECWLNGCQISAKERVALGHGAMIGPGTRIYDSDHAIDEDRPEGTAPVEIGECVWVASDVTIVKGSVVGGHSVIGARSVVTGTIPPHSLALGAPARRKGAVGKRRPFM